MTANGPAAVLPIYQWTLDNEPSSAAVGRTFGAINDLSRSCAGLFVQNRPYSIMTSDVGIKLVSIAELQNGLNLSSLFD